MMRRIKTLQDLSYEKMRLCLLRLEQEKSIRADWNTLKLSVAGMVLLRQTLDQVADPKTGPSDWMAGLLHIGAATLGEKLGNLTAKKIETTLSNAIQMALVAWIKKRKT